MDKAAEALGNFSKQLSFWRGRGTNLVTYPIAQNKYMSVGAYVRDEREWLDEKHTSVASKQDIIHAFSNYGPTIRRFVELLPEEQNRWGLFDMLDHPLSTYAYGCVALAGDAAHSSTPHHGSGAGMGIEDALALATVIERANDILKDDNVDKTTVISSALKAYDSARRERSQWGVFTSRRQGRLAKSEDAEIGDDLEKFIKDTQERLHKLIHFDWEDMLAQAIKILDDSLGTTQH